MREQGRSGERGDGSGSQQPRFSLLDGSYHASSDQNGLAAGDVHSGAVSGDASSTALACRAEQALQLTGRHRSSPPHPTSACPTSPHAGSIPSPYLTHAPPYPTLARSCGAPPLLNPALPLMFSCKWFAQYGQGFTSDFAVASCLQEPICYE